MKKSLAFAALFLLLLAAYLNSFSSQFHFDDFHQLVNNSNVRSLSNVPRFFVEPGACSYEQGQTGYRPLTLSSFAFNYAFSGYNVRGYHALNLLLHFLNAFLVYIVVGMALKAAGREDASFIALPASLIFALHPVQTGAVTYISSRAVLLAGSFYLLAFVSFLRFRAGCRARHIWGALSPVFFILGLLCKEMPVSLLGVIFAYDLIFTIPKKGPGWEKAKVFLYYAPFAALLVAYLAVRNALSASVADAEAPRVMEYLMSEAKVFLMYVRLLLLPMNQNNDYDLPVTRSLDAHVAISALVVALLLFLLFRLKRKDPAAAFFGFWFFIALAPESSLVPIKDIAVEYRLYLPSVGFITALVILLGRLPLLKSALAKGAVLAGIIVLFGVLTYARNSVWATEATLWRDVVNKSPQSMRARCNLGKALVDGKRYDEACKVLTRALEIDPFYGSICIVHNNLGVCLMETGRYEEALAEFETSERIYPGSVEPYGNMGVTYFRMGRYREAVDAYQKAAALSPGFTLVHLKLAECYTKLGRDNDALNEAEIALRTAPMDFTTNYYLAALYQSDKLYDKALEQARAALGLASDAQQRKDAEALLGRLEGGRK